jgi:hypothetical protein
MSIGFYEFLGGPRDGVFLPVADDVETIVIREGHIVHRYDLSEVYEGPKIRQVFRETQVVPLPIVFKEECDD